VNEFRRTALGIVGSLALVGTVAGVTYGVASVLDGLDPQERSGLVEATGAATPAGTAAPPTAASDRTNLVDGVLLTDNRDRLSLCVERSDVTGAPQVEATAMSAIATALEEIKQHPRWELISSTSPMAATTEVVQDCPRGPALYDPLAGPEYGEFITANAGYLVQKPSPHKVHVFVLPDEEIFRVVGGPERSHEGIEEVFCPGADSCVAVTRGLYLGVSELGDATLIQRELQDALGIR
jgi:hypothetical protein